MEIVRERAAIVRQGPGSDKLRRRLAEALLYAQRPIDALDQALYTISELNHLYRPM